MIERETALERLHPPFLRAFLRYASVVQGQKNGSLKQLESALLEYLQYINFTSRFPGKPPTADAHKDINVSAMLPTALEAQTQADIEGYLSFLENVTGNSNRTLRRKLYMIRSLYDYLIEQSEEYGFGLDENPTDGITPPKCAEAPLNTLSLEQMQKLLSSVDGPAAARDRAILLLLLTTGISNSALLALDVRDWHGDTLTIRQGKQRVLYLTPPCQEALRTYKTEIRDVNDVYSPALFLSITHLRRLSQRGLQKIIARQAFAAGMPEVNARVLRDTAAMLLLHTSRDKALTWYCLGLTSPNAGRRYLDHQFATNSNYVAQTLRDNLEGTAVMQIGKEDAT